MNSTYWQRRTDDKRGQGDLVTAIYHKKGAKVEFVNSRGEIKELVNALGSHTIAVGKSFQLVNRAEARRNQRAIPHQATTSNYDYQHEIRKFTHAVVSPKSELPYPPSMTNHLRHRERQVIREARKTNG